MLSAPSDFVHFFACFVLYYYQQLEDESDDGREILVIFDFEVIPNQSRISSSPAPLDWYIGEDTIPEMPWLDLSTGRYCNCARHHVRGSVIVRDETGTAYEASSSDSDHDSIEESLSTCSEEEQPTLFTEHFTLKGSTYTINISNMHYEVVRNCFWKVTAFQ